MSTDLDSIVIFARVVEQGSFAAAARILGKPKATVSRKVAELEAHIGSRLLYRTTHALSLTDLGRRYLVHAQRIADELAAAAAVVSESHAAPSGLVRMTAPVVLAQSVLAPILSEYLSRYPKVQLAFEVSNRRIDLVEEGFDLAVRTGAIPDTRLIVRQLGIGIAQLYAAPAYLAAHPAPDAPAQLAGHALLDDAARVAPARDWSLSSASGARVQIAVAVRAGAPDAQVLCQLALAGLGIARLPTFVAAPHVRAGALAPVLADWRVYEAEIALLYPARSGVSPAVRALVDLLVERFPQLD